MIENLFLIIAYQLFKPANFNKHNAVGWLNIYSGKFMRFIKWEKRESFFKNEHDGKDFMK